MLVSCLGLRWSSSILASNPTLKEIRRSGFLQNISMPKLQNARVHPLWGSGVVTAGKVFPALSSDWGDNIKCADTVLTFLYTTHRNCFSAWSRPSTSTLHNTLQPWCGEATHTLTANIFGFKKLLFFFFSAQPLLDIFNNQFSMFIRYT